MYSPNYFLPVNKTVRAMCESLVNGRLKKRVVCVIGFHASGSARVIVLSGVIEAHCRVYVRVPAACGFTMPRETLSGIEWRFGECVVTTIIRA